MPPGESPPPSDLGASGGGSTPVPWPDVSKTSRGYHRPIIVTAVVLAFAASIVVGIGAGLSARHGGYDGAPAGGPAPASTAPPVSGSATPPDAVSRARENDCLFFNDPTIKIVPCGPGVYKVVNRLDGTSDVSRCDAFPDANYSYSWMDPANSGNDLVLCLHK